MATRDHLNVNNCEKRVCVCVFVREGKASSVGSLCACGVLETVTTAAVALIPNHARDRNVEIGVATRKCIELFNKRV